MPSTCGSLRRHPSAPPSTDLASSSRHVRPAIEPARRRGVLRPGQDDHRGIERARLQPALPPAGADHPPGGTAQRLRPAADHAVRRRRRDGRSLAAADHRAVHRLGGRADPRHRGRDAARDRRAARLRRGHRTHRRAPCGRRRGGGALGVRARGRRAHRRAGRRRPLPGHPHGDPQRSLHRRDRALSLRRAEGRGRPRHRRCARVPAGGLPGVLRLDHRSPAAGGGRPSRPSSTRTARCAGWPRNAAGRS